MKRLKEAGSEWRGRRLFFPFQFSLTPEKEENMFC
jgi:hypothetical protein